jgi:hypothetical protein
LRNVAVTTDDVQGTEGDVRINIEFRAVHVLLNSLYHDVFVAVEHFHELLEYLEVERRGEQLAVPSPFFTCKNPNIAKLFHSDALVDYLWYGLI